MLFWMLLEMSPNFVIKTPQIKNPSASWRTVFDSQALAQMRRDELRHLEHRHFALAAEDRLQLVIRENISLIRWVLQVILLDVDPKLLNHFGSWHRTLAHDLRQCSIRSQGFCES